MKKIYCIQCGTANQYGNKFCTNCGYPIQYANNKNKYKENVFQKATRTINSWTGEDKSIHISLRTFFAEIWRPHTETEAENIFIAGTEQTTPSLMQVSSKPVQPWLYTRVFFGLLAVIGLLCALTLFIPYKYIAALFEVLLSFSVPFTLLIFFFEINTFKNISFYRTVKIFLIGGLLSIIVTMLIYTIAGNKERFDLTGAMTIGLIEETGKVIIGAYFVAKLKLTHVLNGLLVGGAIGAGFAAIENIEYANINQSDFIIPIVRSFFSLGTHAIWCAITVAALVLVKGNHHLSFSKIANMGFFRFFICAVILHGLWDWDLPIGAFKNLILIVAAWIILFVLIHTGLREVKFIQNQLHVMYR